jgi:hypothetical protein
MAQIQIKLGNYANDGTGDDLRTAFTKVNTNFTDLYTKVTTINGVNLGSGQGIFAADPAGVLQFKSLTGGNGITITSTATSVNIAGYTLLSDSNARLGSDLNLNSHNITGTGDVRATVWGIDMRALQNQLNTLLATSFGDQGTFSNPAANGFDLGTF